MLELAHPRLRQMTTGLTGWLGAGVIGGAALGAAVAVAAPISYSASAYVEVTPVGDATAPLMATEVIRTTSGPVVTRAASELGMQVDDVESATSASNPQDSTVLVISFSSPDPRKARRGADAVADAYLDQGDSAPAASSMSTAVTPAAPSTPPSWTYVFGGIVLGGAAGVGGYCVARRREDARDVETAGAA